MTASEDIEHWQKRAHLEIRKHYALMNYHKYSQHFAQAQENVYPNRAETTASGSALAEQVDRYLLDYIEASKALQKLDLEKQ